MKPFTPDDGCALNPLDRKPDCMLDLQVQLMSLVITKATIQQLLELGIPTIIIVVKRLRMWILARRAHADGAVSLQQSLLSSEDGRGDELDDLEESKLPAYESSTEDYGELVIQYGFIALFGLAYPPAAIVCLVNNLIESRSDTFKLLHIFKRVPAYEAADIGRWAIALRIIGAFSVWTNAGLVTVTSSRSVSVISDVSMKMIVLFFVLRHVLFWLREAVSHAVSGKCACTFEESNYVHILTHLYLSQLSRYLCTNRYPGKDLAEASAATVLYLSLLRHW